MTWDQKRIRRTFLDYFVEHPTLPHREVPSSPIIPRDDPTLLFTNAGMNQFKALLLGQEKRDYTRACSVQKCVRAGGKHNDLDAVGKDARHLTWFEMLGNWSFGDYYKEAAITMAWKLSTEVYGLDREKIYVSVYKDDDESVAIWKDVAHLPDERIYRFGDVEKGDEENFWSMGDTGPCGPCTELFYDLGPEAGTGPDDYMGGEGDRYMEFWNNVFMDSNRSADGSMTPLALQSVDTGMGMERITLILQGKLSVYETDLFQPIIRETMRRTGADWNDPERRVDLQVIADHLRCLTFTISEGGQFSNEGRGYVLRRILRRAVRHGRRLGFDGPFLGALVPQVGELFEGVYDMPAHILQNTADALAEEEARFFRTIDQGMSRIHQIMEAKGEGDRVIGGDEAFKLYDTFGFPVDLTAIEAAERGFTVDEAGFEQAMEAQRERSREAGTFKEAGGEWHVLRDGGGQGFTGYGRANLETAVMRWRALEDEGRYELVLKETPFYAESGGEIADHGTLEGPGFTLAIEDVQSINGVVHHVGRLTKGEVRLTASDRVIAHVDVERRAKKALHHTATHLLHAALKHVVGPHVEQKGSVVEPDRLRFDFSHNKGLTADEIEAVEDWVNGRVRANAVVQVTEGVSLEDAKAEGVVALFGEKYGDSVRTVRAGADSFELCGGNHVGRTGDIGHLRITSEGGVAAGVRRIEAVVGHAADALARDEHHRLREAAGLLKTDPARLVERVEALLDEQRSLKKALDKARRSGGAVDADALIEAAIEVAGVPLVAAQVQVDARDTLAALADRLRDKLPGGVMVLGAELDGAVAIIAAVGPRLKGDARFHAGKLVKAVTERVDGKGGGRPDFAQGGGKSPDKLPAAIAAVPALVADIAG
ncbi:MAG: alanine--tRNA ligase [Myxococcales bacterium]|nr:alanine--tRNA ligase [Myxococcales bacterium]